MKFESLENRIGFSILFVELAIGVCFNGALLYILMRKRNRTIGDLLIIQLSCSEISIALWDLINYSLHIHWDRSEESKVHLTGQVITSMFMYQSVLCITLDRILAVRLTYKYNVVVTRQRILFTSIVIFLISSVLGIIEWFGVNVITTVIAPFWSCLNCFVIIGGYSYIILSTHIRRRKLIKDSSSTTAPNIRYTVPFCISATFFLFLVIPDIVLSVNMDLYCIWFLVVWALNMICDPLIYVLIWRCRPNTNAPINSD